MPPNLLSSPTILAVDDSVSIQELIRSALGDYRVIVAGNTVEALAALHHEPVALMLVDISMPGLDGLELCRMIRRSPHLKALPIILVTARKNLSDKIEGRLAGATEYLTKPFDPNKLQTLVETILNTPSYSQSKR